MATEILTVYCCDRNSQAIEVEIDGERFTEEFTDDQDLYIQLLFRGLDDDSIDTILSDARRARANGWYDRPEPPSAKDAPRAACSTEGHGCAQAASSLRGWCLLGFCVVCFWLAG